MKEEYWLGTKFNKKNEFFDFRDRGLFCARYVKYKRILLFGPFGGEYASQKSIKPAVFIPVTTFLDEKNNIVLEEQK